MAPLGLTELRRALRGTWLLARFDARGFVWFDASPGGFWRSFWAAALVAPFEVAVAAGEMIAKPPPAPLRFALAQATGLAVGWLLWPLLSHYLVGWLGRRERYFTYMVAYNWFHVPMTLIQLPVTVLFVAGAADSQGVLALWLVTLIAVLGYEWFITRSGLALGGATAAALTLIDFLVSVFLDHLTDLLS